MLTDPKRHSLPCGLRRASNAMAAYLKKQRYDVREPSAALRVLVAEDNAVNQRLITRLLEKRGHQAKVAGNGREAVDALTKDVFDLVLMDVQMPEMDGLAATATIRERELVSGWHQPVIALTAHAMKGDQERCLAAGMDGYLTKPIRPEELDAILEKYSPRKTKGRNLLTAAEATPSLEASRNMAATIG